MQKNLNIEKFAFIVVQMKFLAMDITNQKWSFDIFTVGNLLNIFMEHDLYLMIFWHKKIDNFDPYNVFLAIATNIAMLLKTDFVVQGHIYVNCPKTQTAWSKNMNAYMNSIMAPDPGSRCSLSWVSNQVLHKNVLRMAVYRSKMPIKVQTDFL